MSLNVKYVPRRNRIVPDALSSTHVTNTYDSNIDDDNISQVYVIMSNLPTSDSQLEEIAAEIETRLINKEVKEIVLSG